MDAKIAAELNRRAEDAYYYAQLESARGYCIDEGDINRPARVERSRLSAIWLIDNPRHPGPAAGALLKLAHHSSNKIRLAALDSFAEVVNIKGIVESRPEFDSRYLSLNDFIKGVKEGTAELIEKGWPRSRHPELEFLRRQAELETGWSRKYAAEPGADQSTRELRYLNAFDRIRARYYRAQKNQKVAKTAPA